MRLLFDQNISFRIIKKTHSFFTDCKHVSGCGLSDHEDAEIWQYAKNNNYAIVTFDSDFYDISIINGIPPKIIWIRSGNLTTNEIAQLMINNKEAIHSFLESDDFKDIACLELEK
jgi:predicted nuclease of predicted toxin-antitoxin system